MISNQVRFHRKDYTLCCQNYTWNLFQLRFFLYRRVTRKCCIQTRNPRIEPDRISKNRARTSIEFSDRSKPGSEKNRFLRPEQTRAIREFEPSGLWILDPNLDNLKYCCLMWFRCNRISCSGHVTRIKAWSNRTPHFLSGQQKIFKSL